MTKTCPNGEIGDWLTVLPTVLVEEPADSDMEPELMSEELDPVFGTEFVLPRIRFEEAPTP